MKHRDYIRLPLILIVIVIVYGIIDFFVSSNSARSTPIASEKFAFVTFSYPKITIYNPQDFPIVISQIKASLPATPSATISITASEPDSFTREFDFQKWRDKAMLAVLSTDISSHNLIIPPGESHVYKMTSAIPFTLSALEITANAKTIVRSINTSSFSDFSNTLLSAPDFARKFPLFKPLPNSTNTYIIPPGRHLVPSTIIIPHQVEIHIQPGAILSMGPGISIISYGKIIAQGNISQPIVFTNNGQSPRGVVAVVGPSASGSIFNYVISENGGEMSSNGLYFSGGLASHYADVTVTNSIIRDNHGDDGLNIKHAQAIVSDNQFLNNQFDGLDLDVVTGEITGNVFTNQGNDGLDISFSQVIISQNQITDSGDKCISIGEESKLVIKDNSLNDCQIGVAIKDGSQAIIERNRFKNNPTAIAAYKKKAIFSGGIVAVKDNLIEQSPTEYDISPESTLTIL